MSKTPMAMDNSPGNPTPVSPVGEVSGRINLVDGPPVRIRFTVQGEPRPAGSKTALPVWDRKAGDYRRTPDGRIMTRVIHNKTKTKEPTQTYMQRVAAVAREVYTGELLRGALILRLRFVRPRPKGHFGTGRNAGKLKASAPLRPTTKPDLTKLQRAVEDALTQVIWYDDSQVCRVESEKVWGTHHHVTVEIQEAME